MGDDGGKRAVVQLLYSLRCAERRLLWNTAWRKFAVGPPSRWHLQSAFSATFEMHAPTRPSAVYPYFTIILAHAVCDSPLRGTRPHGGKRCDASPFPARAVVLSMNCDCENERDVYKQPTNGIQYNGVLYALRKRGIHSFAKTKVSQNFLFAIN